MGDQVTECPIKRRCMWYVAERQPRHITRHIHRIRTCICQCYAQHLIGKISNRIPHNTIYQNLLSLMEGLFLRLEGNYWGYYCTYTCSSLHFHYVPSLHYHTQSCLQLCIYHPIVGALYTFWLFDTLPLLKSICSDIKQIQQHFCYLIYFRSQNG